MTSYGVMLPGNISSQKYELNLQLKRYFTHVQAASPSHTTTAWKNSSTEILKLTNQFATEKRRYQLKLIRRDNERLYNRLLRFRSEDDIPRVDCQEVHGRKLNLMNHLHGHAHKEMLRQKKLTEVNEKLKKHLDNVEPAYKVKDFEKSFEFHSRILPMVSRRRPASGIKSPIRPKSRTRPSTTPDIRRPSRPEPKTLQLCDSYDKLFENNDLDQLPMLSPLLFSDSGSPSVTHEEAHLHVPQLPIQSISLPALNQELYEDVNSDTTRQTTMDSSSNTLALFTYQSGRVIVRGYNISVLKTISDDELCNLHPELPISLSRCEGNKGVLLFAYLSDKQQSTDFLELPYHVINNLAGVSTNYKSLDGFGLKKYIKESEYDDLRKLIESVLVCEITGGSKTPTQLRIKISFQRLK